MPDGEQHRDYGLMAGLLRLPVEGHEIIPEFFEKY